MGIAYLTECGVCSSYSTILPSLATWIASNVVMMCRRNSMLAPIADDKKATGVDE